MRVRTLLSAATIIATCCGAANAEVKAAAPDGLVLQYKLQAPLKTEAAWKRLLDVGSWWSSDHTYSGSAANLHLDAVAGGCWCELWPGGEVEHAQVVYMRPNQALRFSTALGPLQGLGVSGALTFTLAPGPTDNTTEVTVDYVVVGSSLSGLDKLATDVDQVLGEQVKRLATPPTLSSPTASAPPSTPAAPG
ncbi:MAG TPA: hypothetical protein VG942_01900 [Hyphomonadaceae bacterium]|nr:hypothetical protein [Hyphomonadaceae bacterium]